MAVPVGSTSSSGPTRVLCVDDSADITAVLRLIIEAEPAMLCVGCIDSADRLLEEVRARVPRPDVVLLDATMPGRSPLAAMSELRVAFPETRTIIYSGHDDSEFIDRALEAGAWGCVSKDDAPDSLMRAVREVAAGNMVVPLRNRAS